MPPPGRGHGLPLVLRVMSVPLGAVYYGISSATYSSLHNSTVYNLRKFDKSAFINVVSDTATGVALGTVLPKYLGPQLAGALLPFAREKGKILVSDNAAFIVVRVVGNVALANVLTAVNGVVIPAAMFGEFYIRFTFSLNVD